MRILTSEQMRAADRHAIDAVGIPSLVLMENAGAEVASAIEDAFGDPAALSLLVLCGTGNNGGDGMACARRLASHGAAVRVLLVGDETRLSPDASHQWKLLARVGLAAEACSRRDWDDESARLETYDLVVDAMLGTGARGGLKGLLAVVVEDVNAASVPVVAIDVPTGLVASSAAVTGPAIDAALTVTFAAPKIAHVFGPADETCGDVVVADIGIPRESLEAAGSQVELKDDAEILEWIGPLLDRPASAHKGDFGHVLVVGGAAARPGAVALAGRGALVAGAGLVTVAAPAPCTSAVAAHAAELMHAPLPATDAGEVAETVDAAALLLGASVVAVGPGLGTSAGAVRLVRELLATASVPMVLDADALNVLAAHGVPDPRADRALVLTPHPGEMRRLCAAMGIAFDQQDVASRIEASRAMAQRLHAVVALKGTRTLVAEPDGLVHVVPTGNPGMATAGTGDVLTGLVAGLLAQSLAPLRAAAAAAFLHGRAGDLAAAECGQLSLLASDLLRCFPAAVRSLEPGEDDE